MRVGGYVRIKNQKAFGAKKKCGKKESRSQSGDRNRVGKRHLKLPDKMRDAEPITFL